MFLLCEAVDAATRLTNAQKRQLVELYQLLTLENVGDPDRIESALLAEIDLASPFVEDCCLLAEKLEALLRQIAEDESSEEENEAVSMCCIRSESQEDRGSYRHHASPMSWSEHQPCDGLEAQWKVLK